MNIDLFTGSNAVLNKELIKRIESLIIKDMIELSHKKDNDGFELIVTATLIGAKNPTKIVSYHPDKESLVASMTTLSLFFTKRNALVVIGGCINNTMASSNVLNASLAYKYATLGDHIAGCKTLKDIRNVWMGNRAALEQETPENEMLKNSFNVVDAFIQKIKV